jgi:N-methylhydantoinase A/oxoprolinase/acetone carboxylase beta subunit
LAGKLRVGIDVGGTFTDVVAVDSASRAIVASIKVPTTHDAPEGVAAGIVEGIGRLMLEHGIEPGAIAFIAHSTTQATNALLEGDLAPVAVLMVAQGPFAGAVRGAMRFGPIPLGAHASFAPRFFAAADVESALDGCAYEGVEAVAVSAAFGVDRPEREVPLVERARERGFAATSGHEVSSMYGLRARTRTAALNAAILPRMLRTARVTAQAVADARIGAPLMIMRSDGGVMDVREVERRPILTLLSGPAAGVAGALLHENVTDGIFIEVGGTSADCSVIRNGLPQMRPARIGGYRTMLRTVDVRTLGIAGGSLAVLDGRTVRDVGPRSAHIAGYAYASFTAEDELAGARWEPHDGFAALVTPAGTRVALTPTCAANLLGIVPERAFARGVRASVERAFALAGAALDRSPEQLARTILDLATAKVRAAIDELVADYGLERATLTVVGGGGGAAALLPYAAEKLGFTFRLARDAEVISPLGVALALVRDVVERNIVDPTPDDVVRVRREAREAAIASGADPERVEVAVEIDPRRNLVRATASGATALAESAAHAVAAPGERRAAAARQLAIEPGAVSDAASAGTMSVYRAAKRVGARERPYLCVVDERAVARLILPNAAVVATDAGGCEAALERAIEGATAFGDVGRVLPDVFLVYNARIAELRGLTSAAQALSLAREELSGLAPQTAVAIVLSAVA